MRVPAESMVIIWITLTFADIFKLKLKRYSMMAEMIMPWVSITSCYKRVTISVMNFQ